MFFRKKIKHVHTMHLAELNLYHVPNTCAPLGRSTGSFFGEDRPFQGIWTARSPDELSERSLEKRVIKKQRLVIIDAMLNGSISDA